MKLAIKVVLDSGGEITLNGDNLTAEDVNEVFERMAGTGVVASWQRQEGNDVSSPVRTRTRQRRNRDLGDGAGG